MPIPRMRFTVRRMMVAVAVVGLLLLAWKQWFPRYRTIVWTNRGMIYRWTYDLWDTRDALHFEQDNTRLSAVGDDFLVE